MNAREILSGDQLREKISSGVKKTMNTVCGTMGVNGKYVIIENEHGLDHITKDGATIAKSISYEDPYENMGSKALVDSALGVEDRIGDGTTTATLIAGMLYLKCSQLIASGSSHMEIKIQLRKELEVCKKEILKLVKKKRDFKTLEKIAMVSSNHDAEISAMVASVYDKVGENGDVNLRVSDGTETTFICADGFVIPQGYIHKVFCNDKLTFTAKNGCYVIVIAGVLEAMSSIRKLIQVVVDRKDGKPILVMADGFSNDALDSFLANRKKGIATVLPMEKPTYGGHERINEDFAVASGAKLIDGVAVTTANADETCIGHVKEVVSTFEKTTVVLDKIDISDYLKNLENEMEAIGSRVLKKKWKQRISRLEGKIATIYVGADTSTEAGFKMDVFDDCIKATKNCLTHGYVAGGGATYLKLAQILGQHSILQSVLMSPITNMLTISGFDADEVERMVERMVEANKEKYGSGYNLLDVLEGEPKIVNLMKGGVVEPASLPIACIENACSVATLLFCSDSAITNVRDFNINI